MSPFLMIHIGAGSVGFLSGATALSVRKGEGLHRAAGTIFFLSMLTMAASATYLAVLIHQGGNAVGGILTFYLVATAWLTVRRKENSVGAIEYGALAVALAAAAGDLAFGLQAAASPTGRLDGLPPPPYFIFASVAALAAALDVKVIVRGGIAGAARIAQHLWRMCFALFIATGSFFVQLQKMLPAALHGPQFLFVGPLFVVLALMIFWLVRVRLTNWFKQSPVASSVAASAAASAVR